MIYRFANPQDLRWLLLIPFFLGLAIFSARRQRESLKSHIHQRLLPFLVQTVSVQRRRLKWVLEMAALALFIFALARPQAGQSRERVKSEGVELLLVVDVSQSMLSEDVRPSRLEFAKRELGRLVDMSTGDRIGVIAFAGSAILLSPLTTDHNAIKMYLESLSPQSVSTQGTEFRKALNEAEQAFARGGVEGGNGSVTTRAIVIASDGEDHEPGADEAARKLVEKGIRIFTLGFGTEKGGPIPLRDSRGVLDGYLKDSAGQVVLTQTHWTVLKNLAEAGRGSFRQATFGGDAIPRLTEDISKLQKSVFDSTETTTFNERYQIPLLIGVILALAEIVISSRRRVAGLWRGRFEVSR
jgi:Ca-activated chloride channel family protein